ncbi:MAG: diacylglycerol kinase family protein [Planctomycetota bacterium]
MAPISQPVAEHELSESQMSERSRILVVVNPVSGRGKRRETLASLIRRLREAGCSVVVLETAKPGDARAAAAQSCRDGCDVLIVAGGDGTINEAVRGLVDESPPILIVPMGTENILAKYLGLPTDCAGLLEVLREGRSVQLDVATRNGDRFLLVAGVGFDAQVVREVSRVRKGHISYFSYLGPLWRTFWSYRHPRLRVDCDGEPIFDGEGLVLLGNVPRYAMGLRVLSRAVPDDGLIDACVFECPRRVSLLRHALNVLLRRHPGRPGVVYRQAKTVRVASDEQVPVEVDGEVGGWLPAEFTITETRARFLVPAETPRSRNVKTPKPGAPAASNSQ